MSMASVNLVGWVNTPSIPLFRIALKSLRSSLMAISGEEKPNFAKGVQLRWPIKASSTNDLPGGYANRQLELTVKNVDLVLEDVRPYLIADGGNVDVVSVEDGIIYLELQGACGSCPSSTTTMWMGIEQVLKEKFGDAVKDVQQVNDEQLNETTVEEEGARKVFQGIQAKRPSS